MRAIEQEKTHIAQERTHIASVNVSLTDNIAFLSTEKYHLYEDILDFIAYLSKTYVNHVTTIDIGKTAGGNPIRGIKISNTYLDEIAADDRLHPKIGGKSKRRKPAVWIDAGTHARERITVAMAVYYIKLLSTNYPTNSSVATLLDTYDFYIFPVVNPDGYNYTFTTDRLWRKNTSLNKTKCMGVDLNRNFGHKFTSTTYEKQRCNDSTFPGFKAFSELETQAIRDGVLKLRKSLKAFFTFHSFGQLWMTPYASSRVTPEDYLDHIDALKAAEKAMKKVSSTRYYFGPIGKYFHLVTGSVIDWVYTEAKIKYAFAVEVRNKSSFILPESEIYPTANENFAAIEAILLKIRDEDEGT
ncbi:carboxypeptidase B-like [Uloborus diversus]|uniref:carboxypeptidase B-like n=1 Tax=Uloborus diversus TaxID=327109 RepID=UPI00240A7389|nr:carboxypeptidase B-like [Uloborus diversus]